MSFFGKLFKGFGGSKEAQKEEARAVVYEGYEIRPDPMSDGDTHRLAGTITKEVDGEIKSHLLVRADVFSSRDEAAEATIRKAERLIDEQGDGIFR